MKWPRQQAVNYFVNVNGSNPPRGRQRGRSLCAWLGQACAYKIGHTTINQLHDLAKRALGRNYDLRAFDDAVVLGGNVPMDVLTKNLDHYITRTKA